MSVLLIAEHNNKEIRPFTLTDDVISARKSDKQSDEQLMRFATGLDWNFQLSYHFRMPGVLSAGLKLLNGRLGSRLADLKARGGIKNGKLNWKLGVYTPTFDKGGTGALVSLKHIGGDSVQCPEWCSNITKSWSINHNYDDWGAQFEFDGPALPVPCRLLFQNDTKGPWNSFLLRTLPQQQEFADHIENEYDTCKADHERRKAAAQIVQVQVAGTSSTQGKLKEAKKEAQTAQAKKSGVQAKKTLAARAAGRRARLV